MPTPLSGRQRELRLLITSFLDDRLASKTEKLAADDPQRAALRQQYQPAAWLADAARRVRQIQIATHTLKAIHPDARGTNLYCPPDQLPKRPAVVGTHNLDASALATDVVGNAAALDVFKFLRLEHEGRTLLDMVRSGDADLALAFSDDVEQGRQWLAGLAAIAEPATGLRSHTQAKQIYWPVGDDPLDDGAFHLLAPLYPSSLVHRLYGQLQEHRFGETAKEARAARKDGVFHEAPVYEYGELAVQKLGGTKPQNVSQLNSERRGDNYLLPSLPPTWQTQGPRTLSGRDSMLRVFERMPEVRELLRSLKQFLNANPDPIAETRAHRDELVNGLVDAWLQLAAVYRDQPPGWSTKPDCTLPEAERHWLDPVGFARQRAAGGLPLPTETAEELATAFAHWLNARLSGKLLMGHPEFLAWRTLALEELRTEDWEVGHD